MIHISPYVTVDGGVFEQVRSLVISLVSKVPYPSLSVLMKIAAVCVAMVMVLKISLDGELPCTCTMETFQIF